MDKKNASLFDDLTLDFSKTCGIDEAGRGPIAGSLVMAGVILKREIKGLNDSKKLSEKKREYFFDIIINSSKYCIYEADSAKIDKIGLSKVLKEGLETIKKYFGDEEFLFDGNSSFGVTGIKTMVKADSKVPAVSAASIIAKVYRDRQMLKYAKLYPQYGFEKHKGYGTKAHIAAIKKHGICPIHRKSFKIKRLDN